MRSKPCELSGSIVARLAPLAGLAVVTSVLLSGAAPTMSVADIRPGMTGIGRTVFDGTHVEEFKVNIIGVLENVIGAHRNLILAKLEGGPLAHTGVIAGMSGSPVYIDGQLIGAVSYSLGSFPKEPIAGITPIAEMTDSAAVSVAGRPRRKRAARLPAHARGVDGRVSKGAELEPPVRRSTERYAVHGCLARLGMAGDQLGTLLRPIATPLVDVRLRARRGRSARQRVPRARIRSDRPAARADFARARCRSTDRSSRATRSASCSSAATCSLARTGTVTHIDGDRVYAFGHPMYNLGPTEFPMTRAYVYTVLPSLFSSMKLSTTGDVIGTVPAGSRDGHRRPSRARAAHDSGHALARIEARRRRARSTSTVVNDQLFTPLMTYASV